MISWKKICSTDVVRKKQISPFSYVLNLTAIRHGYKKIKGDWEYVAPEDESNGRLSKIMERVYSNERIKMLCVQSMDKFDTRSQERVKTMLHEFLEMGADCAESQIS